MSAVPGRLPVPSARTVRRLAWASLLVNLAIVVTGGAVRLTESGLGCPTWPSCTDASFVPGAELGVHGAIEFGNRLLTWVVALVAAATLVAAFRARPVRRGVRRLAVGLFLGIPAQAVIGGVTVLTGLNPWVVTLHFGCSMLLVGLATVLVHRTREGDDPPRLLVPLPLHRLALAVLAIMALVIGLGTVVTGSGPHAGDPAAPRTGLDLAAVAALHAQAVMLLLGLSVGLVVALHAVGASAGARRAGVVLLAVESGQATIGYAQYLTGLPEVLVGLHLLGAGLLVIAAVRTVLHLRDRGTPPVAVPAPTTSAGVTRLVDV